MIRIRNLSKSFAGRAVVRGLSFDAAGGSITGLLGANGAGKTTTLRMICGVLQPDAGHIDSGGLRLGALLDHRGLYSRLTARENLKYFGELRGLSGSVLARKTEEVIQLLGLGAIADRRAAGFSQGERMKTALGRALLHDPQNLILDEPTNGLDIPTVRSLRELLKRLRGEGACIVLSSHVLGEVQALCDQVVVMADGRAAASGSSEELRHRTGAETLEEAYVRLTC